MSKEKRLIIFLKNESIFKFKKVTNFRDEWQLDQISFEYWEVSTQTRQRATFYTKNIAGYALEQEETEWSIQLYLLCFLFLC